MNKIGEFLEMKESGSKSMEGRAGGGFWWNKEIKVKDVTDIVSENLV